MPKHSISDFLDGQSFAVVGASRDRHKYGNKVLRAYIQRGDTVYPINPFADEVEGLPVYATLAELPQFVHGISIIVPPELTDEVIRQAGELGIQHVWFQPGAEEDAAIQRATELGMNVIANGPCLLVAVGFRE